MMSGWFLVVLVVCGLVKAQTPTDGDENDLILNPEKTDTDLQVLLQQLMTRVEKLEREREDRGYYQVAFSASLMTTTDWTSVGPFNTVTTLVFRNVMTNIGNAYNSITGIFTAPLKGLYYIRMTGSVGNSGSVDISLRKNGQSMFGIYNTNEKYSSSSNGMTMVLEAGDQLWVTLWSGNSIFDQSQLSTFSGFLICPM
ncbi:complement C1q tumor necrosis factor-related protein 3-like [Seriola dumerili]|uniref:complement C1q tumor necrosis factor-related protein 3-like n=1 Tax=Seriola dumerili TaxID=41447 RepID=UPI000BBE74CE|nr:complement C1q tumor necrosis factor-related protein 3-like [Seriola dumerili]